MSVTCKVSEVVPNCLDGVSVSLLFSKSVWKYIIHFVQLFLSSFFICWELPAVLQSLYGGISMEDDDSQEDICVW